jgi:hypothetical protein
VRRSGPVVDAAALATLAAAALHGTDPPLVDFAAGAATGWTARVYADVSACRRGAGAAAVRQRLERVARWSGQPAFAPVQLALPGFDDDGLVGRVAGQ